jgi:hypothetical protein
MKNKAIAFFGDSFAAEEYNPHSWLFKYKTYMQKLAIHYNADVQVHGKGGSSIWDALLLQLTPLINSDTVPDVCVFVWTNPGRLFHREVRRINWADALTPKLHTYNIFKHKIWSAAKAYYEHLYDTEKEELEHKMFLYYVDNIIIPSLPATTKIIHLWSSAKTTNWEKESFIPSKLTYEHLWKHGVEIRPALLSLSIHNNEMSILQVDKRANHLEGEEKNNIVASWIIHAIDNYENGKILDYSTDVELLWQ